MRAFKAAFVLALGTLPLWGQGGASVPDSQERERWLKSRVELEAALLEAPGDGELWRRLGFVHQALDQPEEAARAFAKVVEIDPQDAAGYYMLALAYEKLKDARALAAWENCLRRAKEPKMAETARRHIKKLGP